METKSYSITLPVALVERVDKYRKRNQAMRLSRNQMMSVIIEEFLTAHERDADDPKASKIADLRRQLAELETK